ncbi:MAG TPA: flagellar basal-body MS-ring/collar protein FliF [Burkholderiales bacterium]|nr:flagellar basal-body MS-ring/collar protein FliF [Burkholderiales bacterium]
MAIGNTQVSASPVQVFGMIPLQQKFGLLVALAAVVALLVGGWMWSQTPDYRVLFSNLSDQDGGAIINSLQQMNVPYKFAAGGGALMVPANEVDEVRLRLAGQGLPKGGVVGFELMDTQKLGTSQFLEQVNYQRALEGELERTIQSLSAVQSARVQLAIPKPSVFVRDQRKPTASVLLGLNPGRSLDAGQVSAIVHLVSSSIPDLSVKNVTVVDQNGNLLTSQDGSNTGLDPGQFKYRREVEQSFVKRIEAILAPITGPNNAIAQVTTDMDFTQSENVAEIYGPNQSAPAAVLSQQTSESSDSAGAMAGGVPGALSNQPPGNATAPIVTPPVAGQASAKAAASATSAAGAHVLPTNTRRDSTVNYEVDKTIRHTRQPVGTIKRMSVAVVVNYRKVTDADGKVTYKPLSTEEMTQINALVKEVMGYNQARGDSLNVTNSAFSMPDVEPVPVVPLWKQPETIATAKDVGRNLLIAGLVLFLVLGVLRPLLTKLSEVRLPVPALPDADAEVSVQRATGYANDLEAAKQLARSEPKLVANVVRDWVTSDE